MAEEEKAESAGAQKAKSVTSGKRFGQGVSRLTGLTVGPEALQLNDKTKYEVILVGRTSQNPKKACASCSQSITAVGLGYLKVSQSVKFNFVYHIRCVSAAQLAAMERLHGSEIPGGLNGKIKEIFAATRASHRGQLVPEGKLDSAEDTKKSDDDKQVAEKYEDDQPITKKSDDDKQDKAKNGEAKRGSSQLRKPLAVEVVRPSAHLKCIQRACSLKAADSLGFIKRTMQTKTSKQYYVHHIECAGDTIWQSIDLLVGQHLDKIHGLPSMSAKAKEYIEDKLGLAGSHPDDVPDEKRAANNLLALKAYASGNRKRPVKIDDPKCPYTFLGEKLVIQWTLGRVFKTFGESGSATDALTEANESADFKHDKKGSPIAALFTKPDEKLLKVDALDGVADPKAKKRSRSAIESSGDDDSYYQSNRSVHKSNNTNDSSPKRRTRFVIESDP